jgi:hypothetical protein
LPSRSDSSNAGAGEPTRALSAVALVSTVAGTEAGLDGPSLVGEVRLHEMTAIAATTRQAFMGRSVALPLANRQPGCSRWLEL